MSHRQSASLPNPMVGTYFGIFAASLAAIVILLLIFEQLGVSEQPLKMTMALGSMALFAAVGAGAYTSRITEYINAGRRVPAFYNGLVLATAALGGAGITGLAGTLFLVGFDMMFVGLGLLAGFVTMLMVVAPFLRKFGAPTIPGYLGLRFESGAVRLLSASIAVIPLVILLIAEVKIALLALSWLTPFGPAAATSLIAAILIITVVPGGVRSLSWAGAAQALALLIAILTPAAIAAVMETNLPFGQMSHGPILRALTRTEATIGVPVPVAHALTFEIPGPGMQPIAGRFAAAFGSVGPVAFVLAMLSLMAGVASSPALLARSLTAPTVYETRKSIGWSVILIGVLLTTFASIAVFERHILLSDQGATIPAAIRRLMELGHASIAPGATGLTPASLLVDRDGTLVALPALLGLPSVVVSLVAAGVLSAALTGAAASLTQFGLIVGEDVINGPESWRVRDGQRLLACRVAITGLAVAGCVAGSLLDGDPFALFLNALAFSGSTLFPVLLLSIWWKRTNGTGTLAGLATGLVVATTIIFASNFAGFAIPAMCAPAVAAPAAIVVTLAVSHLTTPPGRHILESVRDLRVPGGETVYDREVRRARQRRAQ